MSECTQCGAEMNAEVSIVDGKFISAPVDKQVCDECHAKAVTAIRAMSEDEPCEVCDDPRWEQSENELDEEQTEMEYSAQDMTKALESLIRREQFEMAAELAARIAYNTLRAAEARAFGDWQRTEQRTKSHRDLKHEEIRIMKEAMGLAGFTAAKIRQINGRMA